MHGYFLGSSYAKENLFTDCRQPYNNVRWFFLLHEPINQCEAQIVNDENRKYNVHFSLFLR